MSTVTRKVKNLCIEKPCAHVGTAMDVCTNVATLRQCSFDVAEKNFAMFVGGGVSPQQQ